MPIVHARRQHVSEEHGGLRERLYVGRDVRGSRRMLVVSGSDGTHSLLATQSLVHQDKHNSPDVLSRKSATVQGRRATNGWRATGGSGATSRPASVVRPGAYTSPPSSLPGLRCQKDEHSHHDPSHRSLPGLRRQKDEHSIRAIVGNME